MPASLVLLDPEASAITPLSLLLPSGLNALHHCIEGVCSVRPNGMCRRHVPARDSPPGGDACRA
jgi:alcohol dehydrogenase class IV